MAWEKGPDSNSSEPSRDLAATAEPLPPAAEQAFRAALVAAAWRAAQRVYSEALGLAQMQGPEARLSRRARAQELVLGLVQAQAQAPEPMRQESAEPVLE